MKKKILCSLFVMLLCCLLFGCNNKQKNVNNEIEKLLTKEEIKEIEKEYMNSDNLLDINSVSVISDRGTVVMGKVNKGTFTLGQIVEFIDSKGNLKKATTGGVEIFRKIENVAVEGDEAGILLQGVKKEDINNSSIVFKNEEYNGIVLSTYIDKKSVNKIKEYLENNKKIKTNINGKEYLAELINYYIDTDIYDINILLIYDDSVKYNYDTVVAIKDLNLETKMSGELK